jgi:hypothetical protein
MPELFVRTLYVVPASVWCMYGKRVEVKKTKRKRKRKRKRKKKKCERMSV